MSDLWFSRRRWLGARKSDNSWGAGTARRLKRDKVAKIARLSSCKNFVSERERFIFDAFVITASFHALGTQPSLNVKLINADKTKQHTVHLHDPSWTPSTECNLLQSLPSWFARASTTVWSTSLRAVACDVPWRDVMAADLCWTLFVADCYHGAGDGELLAYLLWCIRLFGLELWSILDVVNSRMSVKFRSYVLLVVLALVYSGLDFSRCQRSI